jgi:acyl-CoA-binding protein
MLLKFYGYYKQAVSGPCNTSRPSLFKVVERAKWDAWNSVKNLTKDQAMFNYIEEVKKIVETMPHNEHVQKLIEVIGPFFEYVDENERPDEEEEQDTEEDEEVATTTNNDLNGSAYLIKSTTTMTESYDNIGKNMFDSINNSNFDKLLPVNGKIDNLNGNSTKSNADAVQITASDDEEDYCDTSDYLSEHDLHNQSLKKNNGTNLNNDTSSHENIYTNNQIIKPKVVKNGYKEDNKLNGINDYNQLLLLNNPSCLQRINGKSNLLNGDNSSSELDILIHKLGGETIGGSGSISIPYQQSSLIRSSRPNSSLSNTGYSRGGSGGGGHNGGSGGR